VDFNVNHPRKEVLMDEEEWFRCGCGTMIREADEGVFEEQGGVEHECDYSEDVEGT
jgi:hypothetical protein